MKKSRKRLLISSIAMLLVAMLALGTATFAWFTSSSTATTKNLKVYTTKSSELKVSKSDLIWDNEIDYGLSDARKLSPISSADGSNWFSAYAESKDEYTKKEGNFASQTTLTGYVFDEMLNIQNQGGEACSVTITVAATINSSFARLAIVPTDVQENAGNKPAVSEANFKANIYGSDATKTWKPATSASATTTENYTIKAAANGATINISSLAAEGGTASYRILVWFEGQDEDCFDTTTAGMQVPSITFTVTGTAV